jgi:hypothetical protein
MQSKDQAKDMANGVVLVRAQLYMTKGYSYNEVIMFFSNIIMQSITFHQIAHNLTI